MTVFGHAHEFIESIRVNPGQDPEPRSFPNGESSQGAWHSTLPLHNHNYSYTRMSQTFWLDVYTFYLEAFHNTQLQLSLVESLPLYRIDRLPESTNIHTPEHSESTEGIFLEGRSFERVRRL